MSFRLKTRNFNNRNISYGIIKTKYILIWRNHLFQKKAKLETFILKFIYSLEKI